MDSRNLVLLIIDSCPKNQTLGRTVLQKIGYFASTCLGLGIEYFPHFFGPYSAEVADATASLVSLGYLAESKHITGMGTWAYEYRITDEGHQLVNYIVHNESKAKGVREFVRKITATPGWNNVNVISYAAKVDLILRRSGGRATVSAVEREASNLGWKLDTTTIGQVAGFLESLGLLSRVH